MGAAASLLDTFDEATARLLAGDKFDQRKWDELAANGKISKDASLAAQSNIFQDKSKAKSSFKNRRENQLEDTDTINEHHNRVSFDANKNIVKFVKGHVSCPASQRKEAESLKVLHEHKAREMAYVKDGFSSLYSNSATCERVVCEDHQGSTKSFKKSKRQHLRECRKAAFRQRQLSEKSLVVP